MANRLNTNKILRKLHFYASLPIFAFAILYIVTGYIVSRHDWFPQGVESKVTQVQPLNYLPDTTRLENFGLEIKEQFNISGRMDYRRNSKNEILFSFYRPGVNNFVVVHTALDSVTISRTEMKTVREVSKRMHRLHGFKGGTIYVIWAILLDLVALSMIVFSITGFLIWYRSRHMIKYGWFVIVPVVLLGIVMFVYLY